MKLSIMPSLENNSCEIFSEEWRTQEAKDIFNLLRNEYENSKRLNVLKRYKELERIIEMFTSEPVLMKLLWVTTDEVAAALEGTTSEADADTDTNTDKEDSSSICDDNSNSTWGQDSRNTQDKVFDGLKHITSKLKISTPLVSALTFIKSSTTTTATTTTETSTADSKSSQYSSGRCYCQDIQNSNHHIGFSSAPQSCISTPNRPLASPSTNSISSYFFPTNCCLHADPETNFLCSSASKLNCTTTSSAEEHSCANNVTDNNNTNTTAAAAAIAGDFPARRQGIETCVIRRTQIPQFYIPPQREAVPEKVPALNPSLYITPQRVTQLKTCCGKKNVKTPPCLKISVSTPNMTDRSIGSLLGSKLKGFSTGKERRKRCCSENCIQQYGSQIHKNYSETDIQSRMDSMSTINATSVSSVNDSCADDFCNASSLLKAYQSLQQMKLEFDQLDDTNLLARYKKMKALIKSCLEIHI